jgi:predicted phosphodiesterase
MTALAIADLHLSEKVRDVYRFAAMDRIAGLIEKHKPDELLVLGDLTESKDYHPATLVNDVVDIMYSFSCLAEVYILLGNHDYTQTDCPFFHFLKHFKRVRWVGAVSQLSLSIGKCLFLPHTRNWEEDWANIDTMQDLNWAFAHNTFEGATTEHGKKLNGIPTDIFPEGVPVVSGDIHTPQKLGPVTYVGSPYCVDFGDDFDPRVLLLSDKGMKSIPLPGPQKRLIDLKAGYKLAKVEAEPGDIVKVRYKLTPEEQPDWFAIKTLIKEKRVSIRRVAAKSDERIVTEFGTQRQLPKTTLEVGMELLERT